MALTLRQLRAGTDMKQEDVAKKLGITTAAYNGLENLDKKLVERIARLYGVSPSDIKVVP